MPEPSYIIGNSWQINLLTDAEKLVLDRAPFVFACNQFPENWRKAGFRPTFWAQGDTYSLDTCRILQRQFKAIREDQELRQRLRTSFVCCETQEAWPAVYRAEIPIMLYRRGFPDNPRQTLAETLYDPVFHYGSSITDLVNLALIHNPEGEIRLVGCQYRTHGTHFYETGDTQPIWPLETAWDAFGQFHYNGVPIFDCNIQHGETLPGNRKIPQKKLLEGVT